MKDCTHHAITSEFLLSQLLAIRNLLTNREILNETASLHALNYVYTQFHGCHL